jgi:2-amino-4-hydroxy-6-hydroxymethyldihydropteridine diphosphokinase
MHLPEVFVGLGGNVGDSYAILSHAIEKMAALSSIYDLEVSRFYCTTPVSSISQRFYINAVCRFKTTLLPQELLRQLQSIEKSLGKQAKPKEAPRKVDLDILFYGREIVNEPDLQIPHPYWHERLFVIAPLADLVTDLFVPQPGHSKSLEPFNVRKYLQEFPNIHQETVTPLSEISRKNLCRLYPLENSPSVKDNP